jgi:hypothetical protein
MRLVTLLVVACFIVGGVAYAQKPVETARPKGPPRIDCVTDGYDAYTGGTGGDVPDDDVNGVTFGPLPTAGTAAIEDVILNVEISATWIGDVRLWLLYDSDCDGYAEVTGQVLCRHSLAGCPEEDCCGCSGNLLGWYGFDDTAASIEDICPTDFAPGCYGPDYDSSGLDVFNGYGSGGCFWLFCADGAGGDATSIGGWEVYVLTEFTPVEETTWSLVKALYRE